MVKNPERFEKFSSSKVGQISRFICYPNARYVYVYKSGNTESIYYTPRTTLCDCDMMVARIADPTERTSGAIESVVIMVAVVLIVLVTALINWTKDMQFQGLQQHLDQQLKCLVVRNGDIKQILSSDVVVGDICIIKYGTSHTHAHVHVHVQRDPITSVTYFK